jgi:Zn-dependent protease
VVKMHEFADWSVGLGRWKGVPVRVHLLFVLFAVLLLVLARTQASIDITADSALAVLVLFLAVAVHELAHVVMAKRLDGRISEVVLGPFGGLVRPNLPDSPRTNLLVSLAGPLANLVCGALAATILLFLQPDETVAGLANPLAPEGVLDGSLPVIWLKLTMWLNWLLALANFLPVYPFDGAIAYRAAFRHRWGGATAAVYVARGGYCCALLLLALAWWSNASGSTGAASAGLPLLLAAVFVAFSAHRDSRRSSYSRGERNMAACSSRAGLGDGLIDFEEESLHEPRSSASAWCVDAAETEPWRTTDDATEEAQLDDVLAKLHHCGFDGLSPEDRQLLERASQRYRSRRRQSTEDA